MSAKSVELTMPQVQRASVLSAFRDGILTNVLNPKVALFIALMPQFIEPSSSTKVAAFIALGLTFVHPVLSGASS